MPHSAHSSPSPSPDPFDGLPPFPDNVPTAPLVRISLEKLLHHDAEEEERCWQACCDLGFFYLDLRTSGPSLGVNGEQLLDEADQLFNVMKSFFDLPAAEKQQYDFTSKGSYFGYKGSGSGIIDKRGTPDRVDFYNVRSPFPPPPPPIMKPTHRPSLQTSKDDLLSVSPPLPSPTILAPHRPLCASFIEASHALCIHMLTLLSSRIPLAPSVRTAGALPALHALRAPSGDHIRFIRALPQRPSTEGVSLGEHTDFGSVTVLFNRLGGLQVRLPGHIAAVEPREGVEACARVERELCEGGWAYVRPLAEHAVVNLGDAAKLFSGGRVRSNIHRVVAAPGRQGEVDRYSLVYFCRPGNDVVLRCLVEGEEGEEREGVTAKEWILRRALGRRRLDGWEESMGTEAEAGK
ncbi:Clavaminate synthase-like protein [Corynespora cassiicola Philippines]|uniref:Clavaminate synthase-like protein n=1 Tax=Corynespora cassiicola Philippines TaxID=1448308 RepID=A0A2T2N3D8_CORCC|nr:Clavaminate synthase-like protein [Corynespora cassiicola Philippines]